jgi:type II secretory pathway component PulF
MERASRLPAVLTILGVWVAWLPGYLFMHKLIPIALVAYADGDSRLPAPTRIAMDLGAWRLGLILAVVSTVAVLAVELRAKVRGRRAAIYSGVLLTWIIIGAATAVATMLPFIELARPL